MLIARLVNDIELEYESQEFHLKRGDRVVIDTGQGIAYHDGVEYPFEIWAEEYSADQ